MTYEIPPLWNFWYAKYFMRKPVIAGNWKMYKLLADAVSTALELKPLVANANHCVKITHRWGSGICLIYQLATHALRPSQVPPRQLCHTVL